MRNLLVAAGLAAALATSAPAQAERLKELNFGIISTESSQNLKTIWQPFLADMEKSTGLKVNAFFASDYAGIIEGMRFDKVDVAWYGNKSAMEAVDRAGAEIFVQTVAADGSPGYWSLLVTHQDNAAINDLKDVLKCDKSLNFGNGDPNSTSGFLVPSYYVFAVNGADPKACFKTVRNANHETNLLAVANKQVDVATNNTESLERLSKTNPAAYANIKIVWKSPLIPSDPITWRAALDPADKAAIKNFFMTYGVSGPNAAAEKKVLAGLQWAPFKESSNNQLIPIRQLELFRTKTRIEADDKLSPAEKKARIAEIDAKLSDLEKSSKAM